jgi:hypothetical protein
MVSKKPKAKSKAKKRVTKKIPLPQGNRFIVPRMIGARKSRFNKKYIDNMINLFLLLTVSLVGMYMIMRYYDR